MYNLEKDWPRISVVTPSLNQAQFLEETILSVLNQDYPNLEYIIIDGGSTDGSVDIIKKYERYLAYWVSEPDEGQVHALQKGFDRSTGEILAWINSDDTYEPGALLAVGEIFAQLPEADVVYGNANLIDAEGKLIREIRCVPYHPLALPVALNIHQTSTFWRRSLFERVGGMNLEYKYGMDHELFYRFVKARARFVFVRKTLSNYRQHPAAKCSAARDLVKAAAWRAMRKEFPILTIPIVFSIYRAAFRLRQFLWLLRQGDTDYLLAGIKRRLLWYKR
jgi:glycosyltransferase involved in cell wall biosynthesis